MKSIDYSSKNKKVGVKALAWKEIRVSDWIINRNPEIHLIVSLYRIFGPLLLYFCLLNLLQTPILFKLYNTLCRCEFDLNIVIRFGSNPFVTFGVVILEFNLLMIFLLLLFLIVVFLHQWYYSLIKWAEIDLKLIFLDSK